MVQKSNIRKSEQKIGVEKFDYSQKKFTFSRLAIPKQAFFLQSKHFFNLFYELEINFSTFTFWARHGFCYCFLYPF